MKESINEYNKHILELNNLIGPKYMDLNQTLKNWNKQRNKLKSFLGN